MSPVDSIGNITPAPPPISASGDHAGHANGSGAAPTFAATFASALANASPAPASGTAGHAHGMSLPTPAGSSASGNFHGGHGWSSGNGPLFIPLAGEPQGRNHGFQEMVVGLRAYRQQLIASNIANADTPNYKAVDIDFREALRIAQGVMAGSVDLATTHGRHLAGSGPGTPYSGALKYHVPQQPSADGNTVEMDTERSKFAENAVMYEFSLDRVKAHYMMLQEMLKNTPY